MAEPDLSEFLTLSKPKRLGCGIVEAFARLEKTDTEKLVAALAAGESITHSAIEKWLADRGVKISAFTISRHRRRACSCDG